MRVAKNKLLSLIIETLENRNLDDPASRRASRHFRKEFLYWASHTPDNRAAAKRVEFGRSRNRTSGPSTLFGLKLAGKNTMLADVLWSFECEQGLDLILRRHPELTRKEAAAALRVCTVIFSCLENDCKDNE